MYPYNMIDPQQFANEQEMLQNRINQLEQQRNQQMGMYSGQPQQEQNPTSNVNWIQVAGIEGARNQIVQHGHTAWMMDNNNQYYISHHSKLIPDTYSGQVAMIPENWKTANRISVGKSTKQKGIEDGFNQYHEWEAETKSLYEHYSSRLREIGAVADAIMVEKLVEYVDKELKKTGKNHC